MGFNIMDMKKTVVAFAVAGLVVAPVASKAEAEVYAKLRQDLTFHISNGAEDANENLADDDKTTGKLGLRNAYSRFGLRFTEEVEDGTKYYGRYEFSVDTFNGGNVGTRLAYAGADFGAHQFTIGSQWSAWYNYAGNTWGWQDGRYPVFGSFRHRAINWLGEFGPVNVTVDLVAEGRAVGAFDEVQVGASFDLGNIDLFGALRLIQDASRTASVGEEHGPGSVGGGTVIGLGANWAINDDFGLQVNIHLSDGSDQGESEGYTQIGVLATLPDGYWVGLGSATLDDLDGTERDPQTVITGGWNKGISEHASLYAEFITNTTEDAGYTNVAAGWIMNF